MLLCCGYVTSAIPLEGDGASLPRAISWAEGGLSCVFQYCSTNDWCMPLFLLSLRLRGQAGIFLCISACCLCEQAGHRGTHCLCTGSWARLLEALCFFCTSTVLSGTSFEEQHVSCTVEFYFCISLGLFFSLPRPLLLPSLFMFLGKKWRLNIPKSCVFGRVWSLYDRAVS